MPASPATPAPTDSRFPRSARVRARAEFDQVFKSGKRVATPLMALHWLHDAQPARLGLAVSRKVDARAVGRNRIKRNLRETFRQQRHVLVPGAYVVVARAACAQADARTLREGLCALLKLAGALPRTGADGTMPAAPPDTTKSPGSAGE